MMAKDIFLAFLRESLKWLAEPYAQQVDHLKSLGIWPSTDELALELDDVAQILQEKVKDGEISIEVGLAVQCVNQKLAEMSGQKNSHLWTPEALANSHHWESVRLLASKALRKIV